MKGQVTIGPSALTSIFFASNEEAGRLAKAVVAYMGGSVDAAADLPQHIKDECDEIIRVAKIHRECGRLGGRPKTKSKPNQNQNITKTKPKQNQNETKIGSRAQEETSSLKEENLLPSFPSKEIIKETPPPSPPSEPTDFALVAEPVQPATKQPAAKAKFKKPDVFEVAAYCRERQNGVDAQAFVDFYESKGWMIGKNPMKDWKAAVRTWERQRNTPPSTADPTKFYNPEPTDWSKLGQTYGSSPITTPTPQTF